MIPKPRVVVVMPAYNAARTVGDTYGRIPPGVVDEVILVDDASVDDTPAVARALNLRVIIHPRNLGYGANQQTCYKAALESGAEIVVMLHPDGQYDPTMVPSMIEPIARGEADLVLGSRMLYPAAALAGGMPRWKWFANRFLTATENQVLGLRLAEYHTGYRAYSRQFLETIPFQENSPGFVFDTEVMVQAAYFKQRIVEVPVKTVYASDSSSIGFRASVEYGLRTLATLWKLILHRSGWKKSTLFERQDR